MTKVFMVALGAGLALFAAMASAPAVLAGDTRCVGVLPPGVYDNVVVPSGANCTINGSVIKGNLKIESGAGAVDVRNTDVGGNIQGDTFGSFDLHNSEVEGSVQVKKVSGAGSSVQVCGSDIREDLQVEESNLARFLEIGDPANNCPGNVIGGNLQVYKNRFPQAEIIGNEVGHGSDGNLQFYENRGRSDISRNDIDGNMQCFKNNPAPVGAGNTADQKEGQCRFL